MAEAHCNDPQKASHLSAGLIALQFLTTLPVRNIRDYGQANIGLSLLYYPWVGLLIGLLLAAVAAACGYFLSPVASAALIVCCWVVITGALHIDGLADCADAWVGGFGDRARTLEIMKDPVSGPVAVATVVVLLLAKFALVYELLNAYSLGWLVLIPVLGRLMAWLVFLTTPYIRKQGLGEVLAAHFSRTAALVWLAIGSLIFFSLDWQVAGIVLVVWVLGFVVMRHLMLQRLGGCTGDTIGAAIEIGEVIALLALLLALSVV
ncbi:MAG: adenosylcobinamide-GDP ribazoletransferase [Candidatus Pelagadaptatus aseana]|uniref:adenosylcobinamide-GDP ribazoletransferase n=1 Tax=Candidatus Pelagadaptatus aseana TaxID=3120508 RepID=UPI0039B26CE2